MNSNLLGSPIALLGAAFEEFIEIISVDYDRLGDDSWLVKILDILYPIDNPSNPDQRIVEQRGSIIDIFNRDDSESNITIDYGVLRDITTTPRIHIHAAGFDGEDAYLGNDSKGGIFLESAGFENQYRKVKRFEKRGTFEAWFMDQGSGELDIIAYILSQFMLVYRQPFYARGFHNVIISLGSQAVEPSQANEGTTMKQIKIEATFPMEIPTFETFGGVADIEIGNVSFN